MTLLAATSAAWKVLETVWEGGTINAEPAGWKLAGFNDSAWAAAEVPSDPAVDWFDVPGAAFIYDLSARTNSRMSGAEFLARLEFSVAETPGYAALTLTADNWGEVYLDGVLLASIVPDEGGVVGGSFRNSHTFVIDPALLTVGTHCLAAWAKNGTGINDWTNPWMVQARLDAAEVVGWDVYAAAAPNGPILATIADATERWLRPELDGTGSGGFRIGRVAARDIATALTKGNIVKCQIPTIQADYLFAFTLEQGNFEALSSDEEGGEDLEFGGRGALGYLDRAIMWHEAFSTGVSTEDRWTEIWHTSAIVNPVGSCLVDDDPTYLYVISATRRQIAKLRQSDRKVVAWSPVLWSGSDNYAGGLCADPSDPDTLWALESPWALGGVGNTKIRKIDISGAISTWNVADTFDLGSALQLTDIECSASNLWTTKFDGPDLQKRSKATGAVVTNYSISYNGTAQVQATGSSINGTRIAMWFLGKGRALIADLSDPETITDVIKTTGLSAFGGAWTTEGADDYFYPVSYTADVTWKYQISTAVPVDPVDGIWRLDESYPGAILWRLMQEWQHASRPQQPIPDVSYAFTAGEDSDGNDWAPHDGTEEFDANVGDHGTGVVVRLPPYGVTVQMSPYLVLGAWNSYGTDRSSATFASGKVRFVGGLNIADRLTRRLDDRAVETDLLVQGDQRYVVVEDHDLGYTREGFLPTQLQSDTALEGTGEATLAKQREVVEAAAFEARWGPGGAAGAQGYIPGPPGSNGHYWLGDTVSLEPDADDMDYPAADVLVYAITIREQPNGEWKAFPELGSELLRPEAVATGKSNSSTTSTPGSSTSSGTTTSVAVTVKDTVNGVQFAGKTLESDDWGVSQPGSGRVAVNIRRRKLAELSDMELDAIANGQGVAWDAAREVWVPVTLGDTTHRTDPGFVLPPWAVPSGTGGMTLHPGGRITIDTGSDHRAFPSMALARGVLHLVFRKGTVHADAGTLDGVIRYRRSLDGGATWQAATTIYDPSGQDARDPQIFPLQSGRLVLVWDNWSGGTTFTNWTMYSDDDGLTWSDPVQITDHGFDKPGAFGHPAELPDGTVLLPTYGWLDPGDTFESAAILFSYDGGATFGGPLLIADGQAASIRYQEPVIRYVASGKLVCLLRSDTTAHTYRSVSTDRGLTWSVPVDVLTMGPGRPDFVEFYPGALVVFGRSSAADAFPRYATSWDEGATWTTLENLDPATTLRQTYAAPVVLAPGLVAVAYGLENAGLTDSDVYLQWLFDGYGMDPLGTLRAAGLIAPIDGLTTPETDTALVMRPDGTGGVAWGVDAGEPSLDAAAWMPLTTVDTAGDPVLVWDGDDSLIPTLVPF